MTGRFRGALARPLAVAGLIAVALTLVLPHQPAPWAQRSADDDPAAEKGRKAVVAVDPQTVLLPESITVTGSGFTAGAKGSITLSPGGRKLGTVKANRKGHITKSFKAPEVPSGTYTVTVKAGKKTASARVAIGNPPGGPVALGVFTPGLPGDLARLNAFEKSIDRPVRIVMWFQAWTGGNQALNTAQLDAIANRGAMPMITWEPFDPAGGTVQPIFALDNLCSPPGSLTPSPFDPYIDDWATKLAAWGKPVMLRFAHEMNGTWYPWSEQVNGNQPGDYVAAWNCVRSRLLAKGAVNVQWVWSPNVTYPGATPFAQVFPGDGAVSWVALDGYNWGTTRPDQGWKRFSQLFGPSILEVDALSARPLMIGEMASAEQGGDKAEWISDAMLKQIPLVYPQVRAMVWFNMDKEADWRIGSSAAARDAFTEAANRPYWKAGVLSAANGWPAATSERVRDDRRRHQRPQNSGD